MNAFASVLTDIAIVGYEEPVTLLDGNIFRRASKQEVEQLREILPGYTFPGHMRDPRPLPYETKVIPDPEGTNTSYHTEKLPEGEWKYWGVAHDNMKNKMFEVIEPAFMLNKPEVQFGIHLLDVENGTGYLGRQSDPMRYSLLRWDRAAPELDISEITNTAVYCEQIQSTEEDSFVRRALQTLYELRLLPDESDFQILGYFSVLEAMIAHKPRLEESLDSIGHQIRTKFALLRKRFVRPMEYGDYFDEGGDDTIWNKLYGCRSCIAHGDKLDLDSGKQQLLKSKSAVHEFIKEAAKNLIILGLKDQEFLADLREC